MKNLSIFIKDELVKKDVDKLFENCTYVSDIESVHDTVNLVNYGDCSSVAFVSTSIKECFFDALSTTRPEMHIINCNCSVDKFFENDFTGFIVFNNLKHCKHREIIEEIKKHKSVKIL